jgi:simple sugar transport system permease protein
MSDVTSVPAPSATPRDERLAYRGPLQRLLIRPEIGAAIGAVAIWIFFWAVSGPFGTAGGWLSTLDVATFLGIMAVAVAMLMIGGEFDLSSGANTGAMAMLTIMLIRETGDLGGAGLNFWIAIPISFVVAMGIGYFNGAMVERTKLPSFIVTLATFFVLKGLKQGLSKLMIGQIEVGDTRKGAGYEFWRKVFAAEWQRNGHQLESRDAIYTIAILSGVALLMLALYEMHFAARETKKSAGMIQFAIGVAGAVVGVVLLHRTDGTSGNILGAAVIAAGALVALHGFGSWRFEPIADRGAISLPATVTKPIGIALVLGALAVIVANAFEANGKESKERLIFPFTEQGFRATLFGVLAIASVVMMMVAASRANRVSKASKAATSLMLAALIAGLALFIRSQSAAVKFRSEAFSVMLAIALLVAVWAIVGALFEERNTVDPRADKLGSRLMAAGITLVVVGLAVKLLFTTDAQILAKIPPAKLSIRVVWFLGVTAVATWVLGRTRFGSWTFAVGGNQDAARQIGVPAARTKTQLFMIVSGAAWLVGLLVAFRVNAVQAGTGNGEEFEYIIAAVVGGTLLTGGYGTALGAAIGAIIMAMSQQGIPNARWNSDWRSLFLGAILLTAVIANRSIRTRAEAARR